MIERDNMIKQKKIPCLLAIILCCFLVFEIYLYFNTDDLSINTNDNVFQTIAIEPEYKVKEEETKYLVNTKSYYMHRKEDTKFSGFDVVKANLHFLPNFKNPCWFEEVTGDDVYKDDLYVKTKTYAKKEKLGDRIRKLPAAGAIINTNDRICGNARKCRLRCLPYFLLLGVAKSGTSDLSARLQLHPKIFGPCNKEVYWWTQYRHSQILGATLGDYADLFDESVNAIVSHRKFLNWTTDKYSTDIIGDFTSMTFFDMTYWREHPQNKGLKEPVVTLPDDIYKVNPKTKLIVTLRNPTSRLYSDYNMFRRTGSPQEFHKYVLGSLSWWDECTKRKKLPRRNCAFGSPPEMPDVYSAIGDKERWWDEHKNYSGQFRVGIYVISAIEWLNVFPKENLLFLKMEEYGEDMLQTFNEHILPFLGFQEVNGAVANNIGSRQVKHKLKYPSPMLQKTKDLLDRFYKPFNEELASLLGHSKWLWNDDK